MTGTVGPSATNVLICNNIAFALFSSAPTLFALLPSPHHPRFVNRITFKGAVVASTLPLKNTGNFYHWLCEVRPREKVERADGEDRAKGREEKAREEIGTFWGFAKVEVEISDSRG